MHVRLACVACTCSLHLRYFQTQSFMIHCIRALFVACTFALHVEDFNKARYDSLRKPLALHMLNFHPSRSISLHMCLACVPCTCALHTCIAHMVVLLGMKTVMARAPRAWDPHTRRPQFCFFLIARAPCMCGLYMFIAPMGLLNSKLYDLLHASPVCRMHVCPATGGL